MFTVFPVYEDILQTKDVISDAASTSKPKGDIQSLRFQMSVNITPRFTVFIWLPQQNQETLGSTFTLNYKGDNNSWVTYRWTAEIAIPILQELACL